MSIIELTTHENSCVDTVRGIIFTAADFAVGRWDGSPIYSTDEEATNRLQELANRKLISISTDGCYDYARYELKFGDNEDQTMILGPGDGIIFTDDGKYFGMPEAGIKMFLNMVHKNAN